MRVSVPIALPHADPTVPRPDGSNPSIRTARAGSVMTDDQEFGAKVDALQHQPTFPTSLEITGDQRASRTDLGENHERTIVTRTAPARLIGWKPGDGSHAAISSCAH